MNNPVPAEIVSQVESYIQTETMSVERYDNKSLLDEDGIYSLHVLVAGAYARGFSDGQNIQHLRSAGRLSRAKDATP